MTEPLEPVFQESIDDGGPVALRCWTHDDVPALRDLVAENIDHLAPFMPWTVAEPMADEDRHVLVEKWQQDFRNGSEAIYGIFLDGEPVGGCGLHRRVGPNGLDIGYWVDHRRTGQGVATAVSRLLTAHAFTIPGIEFVEIHADKANAPSNAVPRKLGFRMDREAAVPPQAPAETGTQCFSAYGAQPLACF